MAKEMKVEVSTRIKQPRQRVYEYLRHLKNMENFSKWNMMDPNQKTTLTGTDGSVGFIYAWESENKNVGIGAQEITKLVDNELIETELRFEKPMKSIGYAKFVLSEAGGDQTKVNWQFRGPVKFPFTLFIGSFQKRLAKDLNTGLDNLKGVLEKEA